MAGMPMPKKMAAKAKMPMIPAGKPGKSMTAKTPMAKGAGSSTAGPMKPTPQPSTANSTRDVSSPTKAKSQGISAQPGMPTKSVMAKMKSSLGQMGRF